MAIQSKTKIPLFDPQQLQAIADVLGDTDKGLTGSEIGQFLRDSKIPDVTPEHTKRFRLYNAFASFQNEHQAGNHVIVFITRAMNPISYTNNSESFESRRIELNRVLAMCGYELRKNGKVGPALIAPTLDDAFARANRLQETLRHRSVHPDVLKYCNTEVLKENYFHAVLEAMKSVTAKIRRLADLDEDGAALVDQAFAFGQNRNPKLMLNPLNTKTRQGEQRGFMNLLKGLYGTVRKVNSSR